MQINMEAKELEAEVDRICDALQRNTGRRSGSFTYADLLSVCRAGAAAGAERARWIPVSERLPGVNQVVALCDKFGEYWCGQLRSDGNIYYNFGRELVWGKEFTHWMPLPEPPKEGK